MSGQVFDWNLTLAVVALVVAGGVATALLVAVVQQSRRLARRARHVEEAQAATTALEEEVSGLRQVLDGAQRLSTDQAVRIESLEGSLSEVRQRLPRERTHQILLDGMSASGKSTLVARLVSPVMSAEKLRDIAATPRHYSTAPLPVCWLRGEGGVTLHNLRFWDVAGEKGSTFLNALDSLQGKDAGGPPRAVLLIVWDISDENVGRNSLHLNPSRIEMAYGSTRARALIDAVVVFFNKADRVEPQRLPQRVASEQQEIESVFRDALGGGYQDISFFVGSALDGRGVHECVGSILRTLGLEDGFEPIDGTGATT